MNREEFLKTSQQLDTSGQISELEKEVAEHRSIVDSLSGKLKDKRFIQEVFEALSTNNSDRYSEFSPLYSFVKEINPGSEYPEHRILGYNSPSLFQNCPECDQSSPVLMYERKLVDRSCGADDYTSKAFIICNSDICQGKVYLVRQESWTH